MNTPIPPQPEPARERDAFPPPTEYFDRITPPEGQPAVAAANTVSMFYDHNAGVVLPEGTQLASPGRRIGAYFLALPLFIVTLGIGYLIWGLIVWGRGQTPALQVLGMRCWRPETVCVPGWGTMALREIVGRFIECFGITTLISFVLMLTRSDRMCLHDLVAGTVVVHDPGRVLEKKSAHG